MVTSQELVADKCVSQLKANILQKDNPSVQGGAI